MCGIAGIVDLHSQREIDRSILQRMTDAIEHRGPDGQGHMLEPGIALGHRRLAIIDVLGGPQPFESADGRYCLSFNGEIYNYREIRQQLQKDGHQFRTNSDTEVLIELWAKKGKAALDDLMGMFAFAIWDRKKHCLTLARDRLGERPLYYSLAQDGFVLFGSELKAIKAAQMIDLRLDKRAIMDYLALGYIPDPLSIFDNMKKLPPGHIIEFTHGDDGSQAPQAWWRLQIKPSPALSLHEATEHLQHLLDQAVRSQMISDVPLGAFLSGGVDSSAIVASMALSQENQITSCAIGFEEASHDERQYARQVAQLYSTKHQEHIVPLQAHHLLDQLARVYDEPFADSSALPSYLVCQLARQQVTVALSGDGGDEVFGGYRRYPFFQREEQLKAILPGFIRKPLFTTLGHLYPKLDNMPQPFRLKTSFKAMAENRSDAYFRAVSMNLPEHVTAMISNSLAADIEHYHPADRFSSYFQMANTHDPVLAAQYADMQSWLPGRMLVKTDRAAMANSLEMRPALLDYRLVEWMFSLPTSFKIAQGEGKYLLKKANEDRLPADILYRKKRGFDLPIAAWLRADHDNPLTRLNRSELWKDSGYFNTGTIDRIIQQHQSGQADLSQELWTLIMFDRFLATL
ncbi:MAG: asparagine synthase (glutamine-hydrolyzing) [bacterium]